MHRVGDPAAQAQAKITTEEWLFGALLLSPFLERFYIYIPALHASRQVLTPCSTDFSNSSSKEQQQQLRGAADLRRSRHGAPHPDGAQPRPAAM